MDWPNGPTQLSPSVAGRINRKRLANGTAVLLLLGVVAPFVVFAVPGVVGAKFSFVVLSGSMSPAIAPGDVVVVDDTEPAAIQRGDVITFARGNEKTPTTHRVIDVQQSDGGYTFETKGDANEDPDPRPVAGQNVLGTVVLVIPYIGHVIQFANTVVGGVLLFALPLTLLVATEVRSLVRSFGSDSTAPADSTDNGEEPSSVGDTRGVPTRNAHSAEAESAETPQIRLDPGDLTITTALLALLVPYTAYVAYSLQTALTLSVAFASLFSLFTIGGLWLAAQPSDTWAGRICDFATGSANSAVTDRTAEEGD